jgi:hypothetical protein
MSMTTLLLAVLGWCVASVAMAGLWAAVMAGARIGAERNRSVLREAGVGGAVGGAAFVPAPRSAPADAPVAA